MDLKKNGFSNRMNWDFEFYNFKNLIEKMILNIGINWKTYNFQFGPRTTVTVGLSQKPHNGS